MAERERLVVLVCGGRDFADHKALSLALDTLHGGRGVFAVVHGGARGADSLAGDWARRTRGVYEVPIKALWDDLGRSAGPFRNGAMIDICKIDLVMAFPGGSGTADMIARAEGCRIPVAQPLKRAVAPTGSGRA